MLRLGRCVASGEPEISKFQRSRKYRTPLLSKLLTVGVLSFSATIAHSQIRSADGVFSKMEQSAKSPECINPEQAKNFINYAEAKLLEWHDNTMVYDDHDNSLETDAVKEMVDKIKQKICAPEPIKLYSVGGGLKPQLFDPVPPATSSSEDESLERQEIGSASGAYFGGSVGARGGTSNVANENQITFLSSDLRPDAATSLGNIGIYGNLFLGYNLPVRVIDTGPIILIGVEGFFGTGNNSSTIRGIPGTGGIAPSAVIANDSTTATETWNTGILGRIGTFIRLGNIPASVSFLGGVGLQRVNLDLNCSAAGACGTNFIPAQTLSISRTLPGYLLGFEVSMPLTPLLGSSSSTDNPVVRVLKTANIRTQYLHGDFGHVSTMVGSPAQIQFTIDQHVTTNTVTVGLMIPLSPFGEQRPVMPSLRWYQGR